MRKIFILIVGLTFTFGKVSAQFAPPAGVPGTTAIHEDSSVFTGWATTCKITRGFVNISDTSFSYLGSNHASFGLPDYALGRADDSTVVSLGDGGIAELTFNGVIENGPGYDFAVFENGLTDTFLELAFVEVSSDGEHFFRFPCTSLTDPNTQVPSFGSVDATKIDNLAGKYRSGFGTPFNLDTLKGTAGLDIDNISHVRILDVVGCIQPAYATHDALGNPVNDLWPTPFNTGGFDLDGVGVIHLKPQGIPEQNGRQVLVYPNPVTKFVRVSAPSGGSFMIRISEISGREIAAFSNVLPDTPVDLSALSEGIYLLSVVFQDGTAITKKITRW